MTKPFRLRIYLPLIWLLLTATPLAFAQTGVEGLSDDQKAYDPSIEEQANKPGRYKLEIGAIPYRLFLQTADLNGALADRDEAAKKAKKHKWMTPDEGHQHFSYEVIVPKDYDPANAPGLVVAIPSAKVGRFIERLRGIPETYNVIMIAADRSGNDVDPILRQTLAIHAVELIQRRYPIDENRIYITGNSGGGRAASLAMFLRPDLFDGGLPMIGCLAPSVGVIKSSKGALQGGIGNTPSRKALSLSKNSCRYVLLTGEKDFNRRECEATAEYMQKNGWKYATVMVEPGRAHQTNTPEYFGKAMQFLDAPLIQAAIGKYAAAKKDLERGRLESALLGFQQASTYLKLSADEATLAKAQDAREQASELNKRYEDTVASLEQAIADKDIKTARTQLRDLQRQWKNRLGREAANDYRKRIHEAQRHG